MYTGENQTAIRSMQWLETALLKLLETEKYTKITVKDICREADLSRQTFYQMFDSKDELMEYHFSNLFAGFREGCGSLDDIGCNELARQFFCFFYDERAFVKLLIENNMTYLLEKEFEQYLPQIVLFRRINETEAYPDYSLAYVAGALTQTLIHWFERGFEPEIVEVSKLTEDIISGRVYQAATKQSVPTSKEGTAK